ncbi:MAG: NAD(+) diphosphatase [Proteobacteria bacterium]|nr:MAG: NAD(+) diphosphatase [Pseudomonadota bacterium]
MARPRSDPNFLAGPYIDRAVDQRKDPAQLRAALEDPATLLVPVWRTHSLVAVSADTVSARFVPAAALGERPDPQELIVLGRFRRRLCLAVELHTPAPPPFEAGEFRDLRAIAGELPAEEAGVLAYARAMVLWRSRHRFCGRCGAPTVAREGGHLLVCSDPGCQGQHYPRIDPAVIVLVTDGERVLLGRQASWPPGRYSTIAGFVEPGESLEDAVAREVREETAVEIDAVEYHSSQPWPFPSSLMLGFMAHASRTEIRRTDQELEDARWFTRAELASGAVGLPGMHSISFRLIEDWYDSAASVPLRHEPRVRVWKR